MNPSIALDGKTAVITGAGGLLGSRFALALSDAGAAIVAADVDGAAAERTARAVVAAGGRAVSVRCDVSRQASARSMVRRAVEAFGGVDILVNNAATQTRDRASFLAPVEAYTEKVWRRVMAVNLDGMFFAAQAAASDMIRRRAKGSVIQISSVYGVVAPDFSIYKGSFFRGRPIASPAVYAASKAGVLGLTRYLAAYWAPQGIRVNAVSPGGVRSGQNAAFVRKYSARVPMGRMAEAGDVAGAVLYLAGDLSAYVTGQNLVVDGGLTIR